MYETLSLFLGLVLFTVGAALTWRASRRFSGPVLTMLLWASALGGALVYGLDLGHVLTPLSVGLGQLFFGIGNWLVVVFLRFDPRKENAVWDNKPLEEHLLQRIFSAQFIVVAMVSLGLFVILVFHFFAENDALGLFVSESVRGTLRYSGAGPYIRLFELAIPFLGLFFWLDWEFCRRKLSLVLAIIAFLSAVLAQLAWTSRGGVLLLFLQFAVVYAFGKHQRNSSPNKHRSAKTWVGIGIVSVVFFGVVNTVASRAPTGSLAAVLLDRIFMQQGAGLDILIYRGIPPGYGGISLLENEFVQLLAFLRIVPYTPNLGLALYTYSVTSPTGVVNFNTIFLGEAYALGGLAAISVCSVLLGMISQSLHLWVIRRRKTRLSLAFKCLLLWIWAMPAMGGSLFSLAASRTLFLCLILGWLYGLWLIAILPFVGKRRYAIGQDVDYLTGGSTP